MSNQLWSWILTIVGLTGFIFVGRKVWWAWYINIACQILWFAYAIVSEQYGFLVAALAYTVVFTRNAVSWTREHIYEKRNAWPPTVCEKCGHKGVITGTLSALCPLCGWSKVPYRKEE